MLKPAIRILSNTPILHWVIAAHRLQRIKELYSQSECTKNKHETLPHTYFEYSIVTTTHEQVVALQCTSVSPVAGTLPAATSRIKIPATKVLFDSPQEIGEEALLVAMESRAFNGLSKASVSLQCN
ncbi:hypothetical protein PM082_014706 [Marasmius tenuissimus]|nr:hypothetical protein PM082_014706 [Marasmius tenuissimus]